MRYTAVIYTGQVRTVKSVIDIFKKNVLHENVHVFAVLQSDTVSSDEELIKNKLGDSLKNLTWFDKNDAEWNKLKYLLVNNMLIPIKWKDYLSIGSGSMIEYYQMYLSYLEMEKYEKENNITYDYIYRIRCDCVITRPLTLNTSINLNILFELIKNIHHVDIVSTQAVSILMNSLFDINRLLVKEGIVRNEIVNYDIDSFKENFISKMENYLLEGNYLIALRENVCYFTTRKAFKKIYNLGITYGMSQSYNDGYWFNAECQLKSKCIDNKIDYYNSVSDIECQSLYKYNESNYYSEGQLINRNDLFFFLKRQ
jgi:hypothetical protein